MTSNNFQLNDGDPGLSNNFETSEEYQNFLQQVENNKRTQISRNPQKSNDHRSRAVGLMPSDGQEAYKRQSTRSSRRTRLERASYLVATGHLDIAETHILNSEKDNPNKLQLQAIEPSIGERYECNNSKSSTGVRSDKISPNSGTNELKTSTFKPTPPCNTGQNYSGPRSTANQREQSLLQMAAPNHYGDFQESVFVHDNLKNDHYGIKIKASPKINDGHDRGKFTQTYTEVTLPMKTSPAFEYIIKDNSRRNKRCCLWLIYSLLMTTCIAIIIYCTLQLVMRNHPLFKYR